MNNPEWYDVAGIGSIDTPALVVHPERVRHNLGVLIASIDDIGRLRPHIKTHKSPQVVGMMLERGIAKFKCATIAEAEMLASAGARDVLLAYQPTGPKAERLLALVAAYAEVRFSCLVDNADTARMLSSLFSPAGRRLPVYIDVNVGMNRTGIVPAGVRTLFDAIRRLDGIDVAGLHAYDGHLRDPDLAARKARCDDAFEPVAALREELAREYGTDLVIVAGGSPTYPIHSARKNVECSPGTFAYWDQGYSTILPEQKYVPAAILATRVVSLPADGVVCTDLGHKGVAAENPLNQRVHFLNAPGLTPTGQSEEHLVLRNEGSRAYRVGEVLYAVPYHVCPTVALYDFTFVAEGGRITGRWRTTARTRELTY